MSFALYNEVGGLRFWRQDEIRLRNRIKDALTDVVQTTLLDMNQMWRFEEVDTPVIMPTALLSCQDHIDDVFVLKSSIAGQPHCLRAETTPGSYAIAEHLLVSTGMKAPFCVYTAGQSFRQEKSDGATAAKLRFNAFYQLEFQCIYTKPFVDDAGKQQGTHAPIPENLRYALRDAVAKLTGLETRLIASDRLPGYAEETIDIEVNWRSPTTDVKEWKEVCSTSIRTDFPEIPSQKTYRVFEVAFGLDRLICVTQDKL
jgi:glycyl-tRNA synthetase